MTKNELLANPVFKDADGDTEIVFSTDSDIRHCVPLTPLNLCVRRNCINADELDGIPISIRGEFTFTPKYKTVIVIDAAPYWYLKETYGMTFSKDE